MGERGGHGREMDAHIRCDKFFLFLARDAVLVLDMI